MSAATPFVRPLYGPTDRRHSKPGIDVIAAKRSLSRAGFFPWAVFDGVYNRRAVSAVKAFQGTVGIKPTGHYGQATHRALCLARRKDHPTESAVDARAAALFRQAAVALAANSAEERVRAAILDAAGYWIIHRDESHYQLIRPFPLILPPAVPFATDCSGFVTVCYFAGDAPDPNGRGFDGQGYTGTLVARGISVTPRDAPPAALAFYGHTPPEKATAAFPIGSPTHVALVLAGGYVASDGQESGPQKYDLDYRSDLHSTRKYPLVASA